MKKVHFIGIGGIGMSALAQYYLAKGWQVSGSDLAESEMTEKLKKAGIEISLGHRALNLLEKVDRVIYSAAVGEDNAEMEQARVLGCEIISYAQALGELTRQYITLAVSGAHGKSTTTALLSLMLIKAELDPTVIIGTRLKEFEGNNFRLGRSRYLVIEADEYNKSFLNFYPTIAVVTNIDKEHLDTYGDLQGVIAAFAQYFKNIPSLGTLIVNGKDKNTEAAVGEWRGGGLSDVGCQMMRYGLKKNNWKMKIPGEFNQLNAEAAWQAAKILGVAKPTAQKAVAGYSGSWRRMEELTPKRAALRQVQGLRFFSDYAHHPTEIKATTMALKEKFPGKKLTVIFQPHQLKRLNNLFDDFVTAFDQCDRLILLPAYQVAGRETGGQKTAKDLFITIKQRNQKNNCFYLQNFSRTIKLIKQFPNSVVVFMGAGDIDNEVRNYFKSKLF